MKKFWTLFLVLWGFNAAAQRVEFWSGVLQTGVMDLPITLELRFSKDTVAFMGSPSQTEEVFKAEKVRLRNDSLLLSVSSMGAKVVFRGGFNEAGDSVCGIFSQGGAKLPLCLLKSKKNDVVKRPQTPAKTEDYICEEVSFKVKNVDYVFKGTLSYPKNGNKFPGIVLISGSGLQNRDEEMFQHKPFAVIADYMTKNGFAVLRFDDRGFGAENVKELLDSATTFDFANDVMAAVDLMASHPKVDKTKIGLIGHSEGGVIAPIVACEREDIAFVVLLAGTGVSGLEVLIEQNRAVLGAMGYEKEFIEKNIEKLKRRDETSGLQNAWMKCFLDLNPEVFLSKLKVPVLALNGEKDLQVSASQNLPAIEKALKKAGNKHFKVVSLPELNHLFQHCKTGLPNEYYHIEETFSPEVLSLIRDFIREYVF